MTTQDLRKLYGYPEDLIKLLKDKSSLWSAKLTYQLLMENELYRNNSLIPSRSEKKSDGVKWAVAWKNWHKMRGLNPEEVIFAWKLQQDMLKVGSRLHRQNAERRCLLMIDGDECVEIQTREHVFIDCMGVLDTVDKLKLILSRYLGKGVKDCDLIHLSFNHRNKKI